MSIEREEPTEERYFLSDDDIASSETFLRFSYGAIKLLGGIAILGGSYLTVGAAMDASSSGLDIPKVASAIIVGQGLVAGGAVVLHGRGLSFEEHLEELEEL